MTALPPTKENLFSKQGKAIKSLKLSQLKLQNVSVGDVLKLFEITKIPGALDMETCFWFKVFFFITFINSSLACVSFLH